MATATLTTAAVEIVPQTPQLGARITGIDWRNPPDAATVKLVREAFARYAVLCFPDQHLSADDQVSFGKMFGEVDAAWRPRSGAGAEGARQRGVMLVSNIRKDGVPIGSLPDGEMMFHSDGQHREVPYVATTLFAIKIPSRGGETRFADLRAAWDALPESDRKLIEGRSARNIYAYDTTQRGETAEEDPDASAAIHPLVVTHPESGRRSLYLSRLMTRQIVGMERAESDALLARLFDHCERPEFIYEHRWKVSDLVIWDNRCVNHARNDFPPEPRLLRRYTVT